MSVITLNEDFQGINLKQDDPMVITIKVANFVVMKTLVEQDISVDILYWKMFKKLELTKETIMPI